MESLSNLFTAIFTGIAAVVSIVTCWITVALYRKALREDRTEVRAYTRFKPEKSYLAGQTTISVLLNVENVGKVPFNVIEWLPLNPTDKLDVARSLCYKTLDPGTVLEGRATLTTDQDPEPLKLILVFGDCSIREITVENRSYYRTAAEARQHKPV